VGVNYYRGIATLDENLLLIRDPRNAFDRNAIQVNNVDNVQVGQYPPHLSVTTLTNSIPREIAAVLAPLLDSERLRIEGTVVGHKNSYNIPISIQLFSPQAMSSTTRSHLASRFDITSHPFVPNASPRKPIRPPPPPRPNSQYVSASTAAAAAAAAAVAAAAAARNSYDSLLQSSIAFDPRSIRDAPEKFGLSMKDLERLPLAKQPRQVTTNMLSYQLQGLGWLLKMEHPKLPGDNEVCQFWTKSGENWLNIASN
jgi:SWI/SNF-related matrix-associated actin-dependent regulator of chromatin subfamily A3